MADRKARKRRNDRRRQEILEEVAEVAAHDIRVGGDTKSAIMAADSWLATQIRVCPQESALYREAGRRYLGLIVGMIKKEKSADKKVTATEQSEGK